MIPTPSTLRETLVTILTGAAGGTEERWRECVGEVEKLPLATNVRCNWRVTPTGTAKERDAVERAVAIVAAEEPYVS